MKITKAVVLVMIILLFNISMLLCACSVDSKIDEAEDGQQTLEVTAMPDSDNIAALDVNEDKDSDVGTVCLMNVDEQRYASVLDLYYQALYEHQANAANWSSSMYVVEYGLAECVVNPYWAWENADGILCRIGYSFFDLDQNGVNELILGWIGGTFCPMEEGYAFAVYTTTGDRVVLAFQGQERNRYLVGSDGYVYQSGSGGAAYSEYGKFRFNPRRQSCLEPVEILYSQVDNDNRYWWEHVVGTETIESVQRYERHDEYVVDSDFAVSMGETWISSGVNLKPSTFSVYGAKRG